MAQTVIRRVPRLGVLFALLVVGVVSSVGYRGVSDYIRKENAANYTLEYPGKPAGWREMPHSPQTLFLYQEPKTKVLLGGSVSQLVMDVNPDPGQQSDSLANDYVNMTRANMPGWTAKELDMVNAHGTDFRLVRRAEKDHVIYTAFGVRGNTTVLITFSARKEHTGELDNETDTFRKYLTQMKLTRADLSKL